MKNIKWQVSNLKLSKRLKELSVVQTSLFYWAKECGSSYNFELWTYAEFEDYSFQEGCSAYTTSELGVMLPVEIKIKDKYYFFSSDRDRWFEWILCYKDFRDEAPIITPITLKNEANARAKMLIHLIENKIITVDEVNKRIKGLNESRKRG